MFLKRIWRWNKKLTLVWTAPRQVDNQKNKISIISEKLKNLFFYFLNLSDTVYIVGQSPPTAVMYYGMPEWVYPSGYILIVKGVALLCKIWFLYCIRYFVFCCHVCCMSWFKRKDFIRELILYIWSGFLFFCIMCTLFWKQQESEPFGKSGCILVWNFRKRSVCIY